MWQPWAWAVVHGPKTIENRVWFADLRGEIWLHATGKTPRVEYDRGRDYILYATKGELEVPPLGELEQGAIIGCATVVDVVLPGGWTSEGTDEKTLRNARGLFKLCGANWGRQWPHALELSSFAGSRWHFPEEYGYVLTERRALARPVPCSGHQRFWYVPREVERIVRSVALGPARRAA